MRQKVFKLFWVVLLVISSFSLGYYLRPSPPARPMMFSGPSGTGRTAPPLNFRRYSR